MPPSHWLLPTVPGFVISVVLLAGIIRSLLRTLAGANVAAAPLRETVMFTVPEAGSYDLYLEGRIGTTDFWAGWS